MHRGYGVGGLVLALLLASSARLVAERPPTPDERAFQMAGISSDGPDLLEFFRKRTLDPARWDHFKKLIRQLGDSSFQAREKASEELVAVGTPVVPLLNQAVRDSDLEIVRRAEECIRRIEVKEPSANLTGAAARLIAQRRPEGAIEVLLAYIPFVDDETVLEDVCNSLARLANSPAVAMQALTPSPIAPWLAVTSQVLPNPAPAPLLTALTERVPTNRWVAGVALCRAGLGTYLPGVRNLLRDVDPYVRLQAASALAVLHQQEAIPVLIDLLAVLPVLPAQQAESLLVQIARGQAPPVPLRGDDATRRKCREAWLAWYREQKSRTDLRALAGDSRLFGFTMVVLLDRGVIQELDGEGKVRWQMAGLELPLDVQALPNDHFLIAEHNANRVTERNRQGQIIWEKKVDQPLVAQRLPNGNTFIAGQYQFIEVDQRGNDVYTQAAPNGDLIMKAQKLPSGEIACVTTGSAAVQANITPRYLRFKPLSEAEPTSFPVRVKTFGGRIDVLPNGNVLVPEKDDNRVAEYDNKGKIVWQAKTAQPVAAVRLANGNTLVTSMTDCRAIEFDRSGDVEVWEYKADTRVTRAFRR